MKKFLLSCAVLFLAVGGAYAQSYIFVNSEKVFKSQNDYNTAIQQLDDLAKQYQKNVDDAYQTLEEAYSNYQAQKNYLSETKRAAKELIKPIQDKVFAAINQYAEANKYTMVLDVVNNQTLLYYSPSLDKTQDIINLLK